MVRICLGATPANTIFVLPNKRRRTNRLVLGWPLLARRALKALTNRGVHPSSVYGSIVDRSNPVFVSISEENVILTRVRRFDCLRAPRTDRPSFEGVKGVFLKLASGNKDSISGAMDT